jgi:hypothetical protein
VPDVLALPEPDCREPHDERDTRGLPERIPDQEAHSRAGSPQFGSGDSVNYCADNQRASNRSSNRASLTIVVLVRSALAAGNAG